MSSEVFAGAKETPPQGPPPKPFHLPATTDFTLPNGMQVTIVPYGTVPKVAVRLLVGAGAIHESAGQVWLSKLNAALDWLLEALMAAGGPEGTAMEVLEGLRNRASETFRSHPALRGTRGSDKRLS